MSEQPFNSQNQQPTKEGTVFVNADDPRVDFHRNNSVPKYDEQAVKVGREVFSRSRIEVTPVNEVAPRGAKLIMLNKVRDEFKLLEQTDFLKDYERAA